MLRYDFIWVDCYCIDQMSQSEVTQQIQMMDLIYQNAELTIIAAAGKYCSYGLLGVKTRRCQPNVSAEIWGTPLVSTMYSPAVYLRESVWFTRGRTYQEAFFPRRRLTFTTQQAWFECSTMSCYKSFIEAQDTHSPDSNSADLQSLP